MENPESEEEYDAITGIRIFKIVVFAIIFIAGSFLNILMFLAVTRKHIRHQRTSRSFIRLIQNLACADVLFLCFVVPFDSAWWDPRDFPYGGAACKILWPLRNTAFEAIVLTYVLLSFHRTYGVKQQLFGQMNDIFVMFIIFSIWIASMLTTLPYIIFLNYDAASLSCIEMWPLLDDRRAYSGVLFVVQYIVPLMVLLTMYVVARKELNSSAARERATIERKARHRRVNNMLIVYILIFAVLILPHHINRFVLDFAAGNMKPYFFAIMKLLYFLTLLITVTNPLLFFYFNQEFRKDMWHILRCRCFFNDKRDAVDGRSASFSIELPPPGEARVPYSDIPATRASAMERPPHYHEEGSIGGASYHGPPSRHSGSHRGSTDLGAKMGSRESYHGSREFGPPRTSSRQELPRYGSQSGSREHLPYEPPRKEPYRGSRDDLPYDSMRKEPYRGSRDQLPPYRGSTDYLPRDEPPYRSSRENISRDPYRPPSREYLSRDEPPYRPKSREDIPSRPDYERRSLSNRSLHDEYEDDDDQGSEML
ncbi:prolactin-releasing peptide receptor-like [Actinia tenebrosa]|uniref:Prolactin-releasing peptide receptor-like n=1 Tax=Actinia tenebrosa TaxID=6105 RepID=A0A6P8IDL1_ACTTE|nr:prolactin-releasing peptide receptor-like [Actinia tenebrosa]